MANQGSFKRDIISAYLVIAMRMAAFAVVIGGVFRVSGHTGFALLGVVQSTVGILEYAAIGLSPAIIRLTSQAIREGRAPQVTEAGDAVVPLTPAVRAVYANGFAMAILTALGGAALVAISVPIFRYSKPNIESHNVLLELAVMIAISTLLRMASDAPGAVLQTRGKIFLDNLLLSFHELVWGIGTIVLLYGCHLPWQYATGLPLLAGSISLLLLRSIFSHYVGSGLFEQWWKKADWIIIRQLLVFGGMVVLAQAADYLYAPTNNLIITKWIKWQAVADYVPGVQIDGAMLLIASAVATVLLPRTAIAHGAGNLRSVRRYYILGTLATTAALLIAAPVVALVAPFLFRVWLRDPMPITCSILPFMLIHTVVGGSGAVGRAILLAIGRVRAFTISVLVAGLVNVLLGIIFVRFLGLGLMGIVYGTIIAVSGRCLIWLPWYTLHSLAREIRDDDKNDDDEVAGVSAALPTAPLA